MKVVFSERVQTALQVLSEDERNRLAVWFDYLRKWEQDPFARSRSTLLPLQGKSIYMFRTTADIRIFFTLDQEAQTIVVLDVAKLDTILSSGTPGAA
jgi:mRNA-degrading endonuclease RelE of RelBE toxin-antitoxin system